MPRMYYRKISF